LGLVREPPGESDKPNLLPGNLIGADGVLPHSDATARNEATEKAANAVGDRMGELFDQMLTLRPTTLDSFRAIARALVQHCWSDNGPESVLTETTADFKAIRLLIAALAGRPIPVEEDTAA
jgi:hypothetical protein